MMYLKVIQGHWKWQHSIQCTWLPLKWRPYRFWDNTRYKLWNITSFHVPFNSTTWKTAVNIFTSLLSQLSQIPGVSDQGCQSPLGPLRQPPACLSPSSPPSFPPSLYFLFPSLLSLPSHSPRSLPPNTARGLGERFVYILSPKIVSGSNDFGSFILQKSYHGTISLTDSDRMQHR